jgi:hypothetical protein
VKAIQCLLPKRSEAGQFAGGWRLIYHIVREGVEIFDPLRMRGPAFITELEQLAIHLGRRFPGRLL